MEVTKPVKLSFTVVVYYVGEAPHPTLFTNCSGGGSIFSLVRQIHTFYFHSSFCIKGTMLLKFEFEIIKKIND